MAGMCPSWPWAGARRSPRLCEQSNWMAKIGSIGTLTDDLLLSILGRVSSRMAARTSVLSTRWRHLPCLLPKLRIDVRDFLSAPSADPIEANDMEQAMTSLTKATRSLLDKQHREYTSSSLQLKLYLFNTILCEIGLLIGGVIDSVLLKDLDLTILDETEPLDRSEEEMQQRAQDIDAFFSLPTLVCSTASQKLSLKNVGFDKLDMHHLLFDCCKQLKHLTLHHCDTGSYSVFKIDAPDSKLCVLEIGKCHFLRIDLVCLPKLEKFFCDTWISQCVPLTFGFVRGVMGGAEFEALSSHLPRLWRHIRTARTFQIFGPREFRA